MKSSFFPRLFVSDPDESKSNEGRDGREDLGFHSNIKRSSSNFGDLEELYLHHPSIINQNHSEFGLAACLEELKVNATHHSNPFNESNNRDSAQTSFNSSFLDFGDGWEHQRPGCSLDWDEVLCWPPTPNGGVATLPCFSHLHGVAYDTSRLATRSCLENGTWHKTNYENCLPLTSQPGGDDKNLLITTGVYLAGYSLSLCLLAIAMIIFISFKELRCLRNKIHTHLIITYILSDTLWIATSFMSTQVHLRSSSHHVSCVTFVLLHYFHMTNFSWMFVEGLYLYVLVVQTFVAENIKLKVYAAIGWGIPFLVVSGWVFAKWMNQPEHIDIKNIMDPEFGTMNPVCLWLNENVYDWIYKAPVIFILFANIIFLSQIMWVLITKLRSAMNPETQQSRKAAKALLVLMPLLGITYLLVLAGSQQVPIYEHVRALLISTQGFLVALFYCFLNGEVRVALRHQWNRIREVGPSFTCCGCEFDSGRQHMQQMRDWSPRSRTESIRLYTPSGHTFRKRESSASDSTSMTILQHGGSINGSNLTPTMTSFKNKRLSTTIIVPGQHGPRLSNANEFNTLV